MKISHITSILKILTDLSAKDNNKKRFCRYCLQCFSSEKVVEEHQKVCLKINGKQNLKLRSGSIKFKSHFKQLVVPFKIYADFELILKGANDKNDKK